ncbi:o-succinylbenzoate--CoA ligase [Lactococcus allomyrinae]|uniref:2-succinylbenzoate--CoA ligase n=1 Tax=Lactococcus allomyrinae TaxID=2419773 RepID=A0A387BE72_9LACT|nr:o-succinylbenzoate--CoA ligase [Lactococcus allomyrinae]AYF99898.1 o-succinylbenzoate--CoA ligase [Lactococcus allomyrinae]
MKWLKEQAEKRPKQAFLNERTFSEIYIQTQRMGNHLSSLVADESRVALLSENSVDMAIVLFALLGLKKEVLLLNTHLTEHELTEQLDELGISRVFTSDNLVRKVAESISFSEIMAGPSSKVELEQNFSDDKIAVIMNTSATTGKFKSVPITWGMISSHVKASQLTIGVQEEDNWLVVLPMFHVSGLSIIMRSLFNGTATTILSKFDENEILQLIDEHKINMMSLVPTMLSRMIDKMSKGHLRMILLGGEFIPQPLISKSQKLGLPVYKTYGMTESFSQSVTFNILEFPEKLSSVGQALPGVQIEIRQKDSTGAGEIWLQSPMLMTAYLGKAPYGEAFETGDIGYLDDDGFLYVLNRRKDMIISGGENIYPKEIEDLVYTLPEIRECAVVPRTDRTWGQVPVLFVAGECSEEKLRYFMANKLAKYKLPHEIHFMDSLPKNASGKILRKDLKV